MDFHALAIAPGNPNVFYGWPASGAQGLHASTDGGKTWTQPRMVGLGDAPFSLVVDPSNPEHVLATTRTGLYESTDSGNNWTLIPNTQDAPVVGLALLKEGDRTMMVGYRVLKSAPGLYRSTDNGKTWQVQKAVIEIPMSPAVARVQFLIMSKQENLGGSWKNGICWISQTKFSRKEKIATFHSGKSSQRKERVTLGWSGIRRLGFIEIIV